MPVVVRNNIGSGFNLGPTVSRYDESLTLVAVLDHVRDAYEFAKGLGHTELQAHLMSARRKLVQALHQRLNLHSQLADAQERLAGQTGASRSVGNPESGPTPVSDPISRRRMS